MKHINKLRSFLMGEPPIYLANDGKSVEEVVIRYKDFFFSIMIDEESGYPTGDFGWTHGSPITHVPIREVYTATRESER